MCKIHNFQPMKNQRKHLSLRQLQIQAKCLPLWWAKYFGLYACQNRKGLVEVMHSGPNDIIFGKLELRDKESYALDAIDMQLCKQNGESYTKGDFSM